MVEVLYEDGTIEAESKAALEDALARFAGKHVTLAWNSKSTGMKQVRYFSVSDAGVAYESYGQQRPLHKVADLPL